MTVSELEQHALAALARSRDPGAFARALVLKLKRPERPSPKNHAGNAFVAYAALDRGDLPHAVRCAAWALAAKLCEDRVSRSQNAGSRAAKWNFEHPLAMDDAATLIDELEGEI